MDVKQKSEYKDMMGRPLIFLDLEATGLRIQRHEILEIGALKVSPENPYKVLDKLEIKVKPEYMRRADKDALKLVGYTDKEWESAISLKEALEKLDKFGKEGVLAGYNVSFDWAMLDKAYFSLGRIDPFYYHRLDVMPMAFIKLHDQSKLKRFSLGEISDYFGIKRDVTHRALSDAEATYLVFKKLIELK